MVISPTSCVSRRRRQCDARPDRLQDRHLLWLSRRAGVGFDRAHTVAVWVGRADNALSPPDRAAGRGAILFDVFARIGGPTTPCRPAEALVRPQPACRRLYDICAAMRRKRSPRPFPIRSRFSIQPTARRSISASAHGFVAKRQAGTGAQGAGWRAAPDLDGQWRAAGFWGQCPEPAPRSAGRLTAQASPASR